MFIAIMLVMRFLRPAPNDVPDRADSLPPIDGYSESGQEILPPPDYAERPSHSNQQDRPSDGDWSMDDVPVEANSSSSTTSAFPSQNRIKNDSESSGDWSLEEVETNSSRGSSLRPSRGKPKTSNSTKNGDWEISDE